MLLWIIALVKQLKYHEVKTSAISIELLVLLIPNSTVTRCNTHTNIYK